MNKNFKNVYYKIYNENKISHIERLCQKRGLKILKMFGITLAGALIFHTTIIITLPLLVIYIFRTSSKKQLEKEEEYNKLYKEKLILPLLQEIFKDVQYRPNEGMLISKYFEAEYKENSINVDINDIDKYSSNDHIIFPIEINGKNIGNLDIYDVKLEKQFGDKKIIIFEGLTGVIELQKNIQTKIKLNVKLINLDVVDLFNNNNIVSTDVSEFNKYFNLLAEDEILAMRIFTTDIIEKIIDIYKNKKHIFNINIINNKLYIRISYHSLFEPIIVLDQEKHAHVERAFTKLEVIKELVHLIYQTIDHLEI